ncbi:type II secretion system minor pseudopilin GspI [Pantoea stewartii]|uniref:Type II secretion system protein I n=1 Tax=Pantoea stewartii subsp. stewartii DC283 TaxID=660596 RepID=H3RKR9_PANSE|nr:type II secretion system minor pseudopilin GspI [Pantoea stewartii]ARF52266.1 type II secretion system protein GspI [Pantoea stewartii subsp. stewartii DC283]EHT97914.1 general secretion pathway protein I [Pantoea stewartii subsp. stewartii DC283]KAB0556802.1 type II secretion system protein GspI [Pantoea stewartii subsp. stewartii]
MTECSATIATPDSGQRGIVLLEILVALVILAVTGSAVICFATQQITLMNQLKATLYADWVADNQLVQLHLAPGPRTREWVQGENLMGGISWRWRYRYADSSVRGTDTLEIEVFRPGARSSLVSVNTLVMAQ